MHMNTEKNRKAPGGKNKNTFQSALLYVIQEMLYERNFRQKKLAETWQVDQSTVSRIFSGTSPITITKIEQAANLFGIGTYALLCKAHNRQLANAQKTSQRPYNP